jgi:hypothetical protein
MIIKKRTWAAVALVFAGVIGVIGLAANTASADPYVINFDLQQAQLSYTFNPNTLTATTISTSTLSLTLDDPMGNMIDRARMVGSSMPFNFAMTLNLTRLGPENWSATGSLTWSDINTGSNAVGAAFKSTNIVIKNGAKSTLNIDGLLSPLSGNTILVNRGNPWTFLGDATQTTADYNADGTLGQITLPDNPQAYNIGDLFVIKTNVGTSSLDDLFGSTWTQAKEGEVKGAIVPAPAAVALGLMGLCMVGVWMRRYA